MRNTAEYENYLTNPLEDRYPEEPIPTCDECGEPHDEQRWCGECGCCLDCCKAIFVGCKPKTRWEHNCKECRYQGTVGEHDAYFCNAHYPAGPNADGIPVMIYRYGKGEEDILYSEIRTPKIIVDLLQGFEYAWEDIAANFDDPIDGVRVLDNRPLNERQQTFCTECVAFTGTGVFCWDNCADCPTPCSQACSDCGMTKEIAK